MRRLILLILLICLLTGCTPAPAGDSFCTFTDHTGTEISLPQKPQRVAVLFSSFAEIWTLAGGTVHITVGESIQRGFAQEGTYLVDSGAGKTVDLEALLAAGPDLVIGSADIPAQADACRRVREAGIPAALFRVDTFPEYLQVLEICTRITGNPQAYDLYGTRVQQEIRIILDAVSNQNAEEILFIRTGSTASSTKAKRAPDHFVCTMLSELGAHNIADDAPILLDGLSLEEILIRQPHHLFISTMGNEEAAKANMADLLTQPGWRDLSAIKEGRYYYLPRDLFHFKPNARWADAYRYLAELLYPELDLNEQ